MMGWNGPDWGDLLPDRPKLGFARLQKPLVDLGEIMVKVDFFYRDSSLVSTPVALTAPVSKAITFDMASSRKGREGAILSKCCCTPR